MAFTDLFDPSSFDPSTYSSSDPDNPRARADASRQPQSEPIPHIAHGSIPGLLGVSLGDQLAALRASEAQSPPPRDFQGSIAPLRSGVPTPGGGPLMPVPMPPQPLGGGPVPPLPSPINVGRPPGANAGSAMPPPLPRPAMPAQPGAMGSAPPSMQPSGPLAPQQPAAMPAQQPQPGAPVPGPDKSFIPRESLLGRAIQMFQPANDFLRQGIGIDVPGIIGAANDWRDQHRMTLLALAGGLAGSQSWGQGLGRAFQAAGPAMQADIQLNQQNQTAQAIAKKLNIPMSDALVIAQNPEIMKQVLPRVFGAKQWQMTETTDVFGQKKPILYDPVTGETKALDLTGSSGGAMGAANAATVPTGGASPAGQPTLQNFDLSRVNPNVQGWDYLKQFPPEVEAAARAYMTGGVMPTGNPRQQGIATIAKTAAQKVAMDLGEPGLADDTTFPARREMSTQLAKSTPGSIGGQITFGGTSLGHLADVSEKASKLDNASGFGIAPLARLENAARGLTVDQAQKVNDVSGAIQHYGQEITKFYSGSPGGEAERMRFLNTMDTAKSPKEIAGAIRAERDLIPDRLNQIHSQIAERLGQKEADKQLSRVNLPEVVGRINAALAKLDPDGPEAKMMRGGTASASAAQSGTLAPGKYRWTPQGLVPTR
jgi:hypothetical protein